MDLQEISEKLHDRRIGVVAEKTGLSAVTIRNIRDGKNTNPTLAVITALREYFSDSEGGSD